MIFFFVNGIPFLQTKTRTFYFRSVQACKIRGKSEIILGLNKLIPSTKIGVSPSLISMSKMSVNTSNIFDHHHTFPHAPRKNKSGTLNDIYRKLMSAWDVVATLCHTEIYKVNDNITSPRYGNLPEHFSIPKWDIKWPQPSRKHPRVPQSRLQQVKNNIWGIFTGLHRHHKQHQVKISTIDFTVPI